MNNVPSLASVQLFVTKIRVVCFCHPPLFVSSHRFAASACLRRRSLLNLIKNRNRFKLPRGTIRTGREASTGATCHSCPNSACARTRDNAPSHLLPHCCTTRDSPLAHLLGQPAFLLARYGSYDLKSRRLSSSPVRLRVCGQPLPAHSPALRPAPAPPPARPRSFTSPVRCVAAPPPATPPPHYRS